MLTLPEGSAYAGALRENVQGAFAARGPVRNFVSALYQALRVLLPREAGLVRLFRSSQPIDAEIVDKALRDRYSAHVRELSGVFQGTGSRIGLYFREVAVHDMGEVPRYYSLPMAHGVMLRFLRFRLGCHHLRVNTGRWAQPAIPREDRTCLRCAAASVDDEEHCLLHCAHPVLAGSRPAAVGPVLTQFHQRGHASSPYAGFWQALHEVDDRVVITKAARVVALCC